MTNIIKIENEGRLVGFFKQGNKTVYYNESDYTFGKMKELRKIFTKVVTSKNIEDSLKSFIQKNK